MYDAPIRRFAASVVCVVLAATLMFSAQAAEYAGLEYMRIAAGLVVAALVGTVVSIGLVIGAFTRASVSHTVTLASAIGTMPFLVDWALRANGTQLNVHGIAILGFFGYAAMSELCCISIIITVAVKAMLGAERRPR